MLEIAKRRKCLATPGRAEREGEGEERATTAASKNRNILFHQKRKIYASELLLYSGMGNERVMKKVDRLSFHERK